MLKQNSWIQLRQHKVQPQGLKLTPGVNPLSPKSDQHQISPCNINAL